MRVPHVGSGGGRGTRVAGARRPAFSPCRWRPASWAASQMTWATARCWRLRSPAQGHTAACSQKLSKTWPHWEPCASWARNGCEAVWWCRSDHFRTPSKGGRGGSPYETSSSPRTWCEVRGMCDFVYLGRCWTDNFGCGPILLDVRLRRGQWWVARSRVQAATTSVALYDLHRLFQKDSVLLLEAKQAAGEWRTGFPDDP